MPRNILRKTSSYRFNPYTPGASSGDSQNARTPASEDRAYLMRRPMSPAPHAPISAGSQDDTPVDSSYNEAPMFVEDEPLTTMEIPLDANELARMLLQEAQESTDEDLDMAIPGTEDTAAEEFEVNDDEARLEDMPIEDPAATEDQTSHLHHSCDDAPVSMPPPPPPTSHTTLPDRSEEMPQQHTSVPMDPFLMKFALWVKSAKLSRPMYQSLRKILCEMKDLKQVHRLPPRLDTLRDNLTNQLPLGRMRQEEIKVDLTKLPNRREPRTTLYWMDPIHLFQRMLSTPAIMNGMHQGMAHVVDEPTEIYHSFAWGSSIRSTSGVFAYYPNGKPIFPSDFVWYRCLAAECSCTSREKDHLGRATFIGEDFTSSARLEEREGSKCAFISQVVPFGSCADFIGAGLASLGLRNDQSEVVLLQDDISLLPVSHIVRHEPDVFLDYTFTGSQSTIFYASLSQQYVVRYIGKLRTHALSPLSLSPPARGELELKHYGRTHFETNFKPETCISLPLVCYIDAFGLYRTMYRSLTGIYVCPANLSHYQRQRKANMFPITLGPYASTFDDVIKAIAPRLATLDGGLKLRLTQDGDEKFLCAYVLFFTGDMPQQAANSGMLGPTAKRSCRSCTVSTEQRDDLTFDTETNGRFHFSTLELRRQMDNLTGRKKDHFSTSSGLALKPSPLPLFTPALDIIRTRPSDAAHSEYGGLSKLSHQLLFADILTDSAQNSFCAILQQIKMPPGWGRIQSPKNHIGSWQLQECARASIITPVLLRLHMTKKWIKQDFSQALKRHTKQHMAENGYDEVDELVLSFASLARTNSAITTPSLSQARANDLKSLLLKSRQAFQLLFECAADAAAPNTANVRITRERSQSVTSQVSIESNMSEQQNNLAEEPVDDAFFAKSKDAKKKYATYRAMKKRPNVHVGLHYAEVASQYATPRNCMTLEGESKHRDFKTHVYRTNFRNVERTLLLHENERQTLRFLLGGAFEHSDPELTATIRMIEKDVPALFTTIVPSSELVDDDEDQDNIWQSDEWHLNVSAINKISSNYIRSQYGLPTSPQSVSPQHDFISMLQRAFYKEYNMKNVIELGRQPFSWFKKVSYSSPVGHKRITFQLFDFVRLRRSGTIARIEHIFAHSLLHKNWLFFILTETTAEHSREALEDRVLGLPLLRPGGKYIVGLPSISDEKLWVMPVKARSAGSEGALREEQSDKASLLLYCSWNVEFL